MKFHILLLSLLLTACQNPPEIVLTGSIQGTTYHLKMVTQGLNVTSAELKTDVEAIFRLVDEQLSNWVKYRALTAQRQIWDEISHSRQMKLIKLEIALPDVGPYEYSPAVMAKIRERIRQEGAPK